MNVQEILQQVQNADIRLLMGAALVLILLFLWGAFARTSRLNKEIFRLHDRLDRLREEVRSIDKKPLVTALPSAEQLQTETGPLEVPARHPVQEEDEEPAEDSFSFAGGGFQDDDFESFAAPETGEEEPEPGAEMFEDELEQTRWHEPEEEEEEEPVAQEDMDLGDLMEEEEEPEEEKPSPKGFLFGEPEAEEPEFDEPEVEEPATEIAGFEESFLGETPEEEPALEEPAVEKPFVENPVWKQLFEEKPVVTRPPVAKPPVQEPPAEKPAVEQTGIVRLADDPGRPGVCFARCQACQYKLAYPARLSGKGVRCPSCRAKHLLP
jgi:hypothetical protein